MMNEVYTICEDSGEGSGLPIEETDCNVGEPGEECTNNQIKKL